MARPHPRAAATGGWDFCLGAVAEETAYQIESERTSAKSAGPTKVQPRLACRVLAWRFSWTRRARRG